MQFHLPHQNIIVLHPIQNFSTGLKFFHKHCWRNKYHVGLKRARTSFQSISFVFDGVACFQMKFSQRKADGKKTTKMQMKETVWICIYFYFSQEQSQFRHPCTLDSMTMYSLCLERFQKTFSELLFNRTICWKVCREKNLPWDHCQNILLRTKGIEELFTIWVCLHLSDQIFFCNFSTHVKLAGVGATFAFCSMEKRRAETSSKITIDFPKFNSSQLFCAR